LLDLRAATGLRNFNVSYCHRLTDRTLALLACFPGLEHLDVTCLALLTDAGFALAAGTVAAPPAPVAGGL
jgi:hypothetical protein